MSLKLAKLTKAGHKKTQVVHQCCVCKKWDVWGMDWAWYGSWINLEDGDEIYKTCSDICRNKITTKIYKFPKY